MWLKVKTSNWKKEKVGNSEAKKKKKSSGKAKCLLNSVSAYSNHFRGSQLFSKCFSDRRRIFDCFFLSHMMFLLCPKRSNCEKSFAKIFKSNVFSSELKFNDILNVLLCCPYILK